MSGYPFSTDGSLSTNGTSRAMLVGQRHRKASAESGSGVRSVDVDHQRAAADHGHDDLLRAVERVHVTMHESRGHVKEPARLDLHGFPAAGAELKPRAPDDDV